MTSPADLRTLFTRLSAELARHPVLALAQAVAQSVAFWAYSMLSIEEQMPLSLIPAVLVIAVGAPLVYRAVFRTLLTDIVVSLR